MTYEKMKLGLLIGFISATFIVLALFVPVSTILFALLIGLVFVLPLLALVSIVIIGVSMVSKKPGEPSAAKKEEVVIPT
jgi:Na+/proline symporter